MTPPTRRLKAVPVLIVLNVVVFLCTRNFVDSPRFLSVFALSTFGLEAGRWWQLLTHAFLHGNTLHLLFNMMGLWFAGRIVERVLGTWRFLALYATAAIAGGAFQMAFGGGAFLLGASGAVFGVLVAFTTLFPESQVVALLFFIPVRLKAQYLGWGLTGSALFFLVTGLLPIIGHAAHLGGCLAGYLFVRLTARRGNAALTPPIHRRDAEKTDHGDFHRNPD